MAKQATVKNVGKVPRKHNRGKSLVREASVYNPDGSFNPTVKADTFYDRMKMDLRESVPGEKEGTTTNRNVSVCGWVALVKRTKEGVKVTRQLVSNKEDLQALRTTPKYMRSKVLETIPGKVVRRKGYKGCLEAYTYPDSFASDFSTSGDAARPNDEFHPLMGGPFNKQLYLNDYLDLHSKAFEAKNHNPLAKTAMDVTTNYVVGKGIKVPFRSPQLQKVWDDFDDRVDFDHFLRNDSDTLTWAGEIMTKKVIDTFTRLPRIEPIDPSTVWEIITLPDDINRKLYYHQQFPTQYQVLYTVRAKVPVSEYIINDIPATQVIHVPINVVPGEKRGRSDFQPVLGWLKRFKDFYDAKVVKAQIEQSFAVRKTIKGDQADVQAFADDDALNAIPPPGSVIFENESVTTDFMESKSSGRATDNTGEAIRSIIATGMGLSPEMLGVGGAASVQATAITKAEPAYKKFHMRQQILGAYVRKIVTWVIEVAIANGVVPKMVPMKPNLGTVRSALSQLDLVGAMKQLAALISGKTMQVPINVEFDVIFPEILTEDRPEKIQAVTNALNFSMISHKRAAEIVATELGIVAYDYEEEQERIKEEGEQQSTQLWRQSGVGPPLEQPALTGQEGAKPGSTAAKGAYKQGAKTP